MIQRLVGCPRHHIYVYDIISLGAQAYSICQFLANITCRPYVLKISCPHGSISHFVPPLFQHITLYVQHMMFEYPAGLVNNITIERLYVACSTCIQ